MLGSVTSNAIMNQVYFTTTNHSPMEMLRSTMSTVINTMISYCFLIFNIFDFVTKFSPIKPDDIITTSGT